MNSKFDFVKETDNYYKDSPINNEINRKYITYIIIKNLSSNKKWFFTNLQQI